MTKKQFIIAISLVSALVIGAVAVFFLVFNRPVETDNVVSTVDLSSEDIAAVEVLAGTFLQEGANFGINLDTMSSETASQRMQDIANDNGGTSWIKREDVAGSLATQYMDLSGGFNFAPTRIANADWTDGTNVASFRSLTMDLESSSRGSYVYTNRDEPVLLAKVSFSGTSQLSHFSQSTAASDGEGTENHDAESTPWDIREQTVRLEGTMTLSQDEEGGPWRVRDLSFEEGEFAFPFWSPEPFTTSYPGTELGGTVVRSIDFPNEKETSDVQG